MKMINSSKMLAMSALVVLSLCSVTASAQQAPAPKGADAAKEAGFKVVGQDGEEVSDEEATYWATVRGIETIQKRPVLKEGRLAISAYAGLIPNNIFEQYFPLGVRVNYFLLESLGLELSGSYALSNETTLRDYVEDERGIAASGLLLGDRQVAHVNFGVTWSPIFGKTAFRNKSINYFDMFLLGGAGVVIKRTQPDFNAEETIGGSVEGVLGAGMLYHFNNNMGLRLDFRQFIFLKASGGVANPSEVSVGFMYML